MTTESKIEIPDTSTLIPRGWHEQLISVRNLSEWIGFFTETLNWELLNQEKVSPDTLAAWQLPEDANAESALVAERGSKTGFVRIVEFQNVDRVRIRNQDQAWETGGLFNMNFRVSEMTDLAETVADAGWQAPSMPVKYTFGVLEVVEWIPRHSDGVRVAFIERVAPPLEGWPEIDVASRAFNSSQVVSDIERSLKFYRGVLGFKTYMKSRSTSKAPGENLLGLSREAMMQVVRDVYILSPSGQNDGSVEIIKFEGYTGRDFSDRAVPPNLGNLMLRFAVPDVDGLAQHLSQCGVALEYGPTTITLAPYGSVNSLAIRAPDGAWLEFFETEGETPS